MILVFGKTGQVAKELQRRAPTARFLGREEADLMRPQACAEAIIAARPQAVINAAGWTAVDKAESEEEAATVVNGAAPAAMATSCAALGIPIVHISTDYVFDGTGTRAWLPNDAPAPVNAYGRSKLAGEEGVRASGSIHAILRTSWVFSTHGVNFLKTILRLGRERKKLSIVADQIGGPTPAGAIAEACLSICTYLRQDQSRGGTYHFSGTPDVSWADFAREVIAQAGLACTVEDIPTSAYPTQARRPANSRMDCATLAVFALDRPDWRAGVGAVLRELGATT